MRSSDTIVWTDGDGAEDSPMATETTSGEEVTSDRIVGTNDSPTYPSLLHFAIWSTHPKRILSGNPIGKRF